MEQYTTDKPSFSNSISIPQTTDTNLAFNFNVSTKQLLENTLVNAEAIHNMEESGVAGGFYGNGMDLTEAFEAEIAKFKSPWAWIDNRVSQKDEMGCFTPNLKGLHVCDYIPLEINGHCLAMQIAGFGMHDEPHNGSLRPHIDFISRDLYPESFTWARTNSDGTVVKYMDNNSHTSTKAPFCETKIYEFLKTLYEDLPEELKKVIISKIEVVDSRFSEDPLHPLTESTNSDLYDLGKLWIPSEYEVFGSTIFGTKPYSAGTAMQYPIFSDSQFNRIKEPLPIRTPDKHNSYIWWLLTPHDGSSTLACSVSRQGRPGVNHVAEYGFPVPICFRIGNEWG